MGTLLQLMALPAACMLFAWTRNGCANAVATALCRLVAMAAVRHAARAGFATPATATAAAKAGKAMRTEVPSGVARHGPKDGRIPRNPVPPRGEKIDDTAPRLRRMRSRWALGNLAT
jgi:hypothetical protein